MGELFSVEWDQEDLDSLIVALDMIAPDEMVQDELPKLGYLVEHETKGYPPVPAGSTYQRTEELFRGWRRDVMPMAVKIFNVKDYGIFVQGREQTAKHRGTGWKRLHEIAEAQVERFIYRLEMLINKIWTT